MRLLPLWLFCALIGVWLVAPALIVVPLSLTDKASLAFPPTGWSMRWYANFFTDPQWVRSLLDSLQVAAAVTVLATVLGTLAALGLTRARVRGLSLANGALLTPIIVPGVVVAIGLYGVFLELRLIGTFFGFLMAHTILALPFVVIPVAASLRGFDRRYEQAASVLGAGRLTAFRTVTLPLIAPGIASGALFAFVISFDEVVVSLFIQSPYLRTLPVQMYSSVTRDTDPTIAAAATLIILTTTVLAVLAALILTRRNRAS
ncbi:putative spermidine/putrescine transport system permease protein [Spinactinospora alkalitolerans]|uniref:Putative spermidine/putrescine transport system permease protein n=1 Tax=Spinactinospora alkalitolerans TaxID=687207 RepID=A0A852TYK1_9ACTN|nr:ABC transporter permease [Spinactinospora alkalitolerans]NYE47873.1 putative spermidine/putrescine transport system permease protein [Spinactinospora alkalitolerans]